MGRKKSRLPETRVKPIRDQIEHWRQKKTLEPLYGSLQDILVSDRAKALNFWAMERRQICWAHLIRKFVSFAERDGPAGSLGRELLEYTGLLFEYWHDYKDGKLTRERFVAWMAPLRQQVQAALQRAVDAQLGHVSVFLRRYPRPCRGSLEPLSIATASRPPTITRSKKSELLPSAESARSVRRVTAAISSPSAS